MSAIPVNVGSAGQFQHLREGLAALDYTTQSVCERTGFASIFQFETIRDGRKQGTELELPIDVLIRLLMDGEEVSEETAARMLPVPLLKVLADLAVVEPSSPGMIQANAFLYPVEGLYVASDRTRPAVRQRREELPEEIVYAAITTNTQRFLRLLPKSPCGTFLDMCSGTGIAALIAARDYAQQAWACDIAARCEMFAAFNRLMNGLPNVTVKRGSLYEPVDGLLFDRIVAHPPYIPVLPTARHLYFRAGGEDGEQVLRGVVEGAVTHLKPGGRLYCQTRATDREGETVEQRIRRWLGASEGKFDVVAVADYDIRWHPGRPASAREDELVEKLYESLKVTSVFYGAIVVQRHTEDRAPLTVRRRKAQSEGNYVVDWLIDWEMRSNGPGATDALLASHPRYASRLKLVVTHTATLDGLQPTHFALKTEHPFISDGECQPWVAVTIGACDGKRTSRQIHEDLKSQQVLPESMGPEEFARFIQYLISNGILESDISPLVK